MLRHMLAAEKVGGESKPGEDGGRVRRGQSPVEATMREPHDAVAVRVPAAGQARAARAALRRGGKRLGERRALRGERVEVRADDARPAVAVQVTPDVMRRHEHHVVSSAHRPQPWNAGAPTP